MSDFLRKSEEAKAMYREFLDEDRKQTRADYKGLLKLPAFRRVLASILKQARVFGSISSDSNMTNDMMKSVGFRELGVQIFMTANQADGEMVFKAITERNELERERMARIEMTTKGNER